MFSRIAPTTPSNARLQTNANHNATQNTLPSLVKPPRNPQRTAAPSKTSTQASQPQIAAARKAIQQGHAYASKGKYEEAREAYKKAASALPEDAEKALKFIPAEIEPLADTPLLPSTLKSLFDFRMRRKNPLTLQNLSISDVQPTSSGLCTQDILDTPIRHTQHLAARYNLLAQDPYPKKSELESMRELARATIQLFSAPDKVLTKEHLQEIVHLRLFKDTEIYSLLVDALVKALSGTNPLLDMLTTQALALTIKDYPFEIRDKQSPEFHLLRTLTGFLPKLQQHLDTLPREKNILPLQAALAPLTEILDLLVSAGISGINQDVHNTLDKALSTLSDYSHTVIRHEARYTRQALTHMGNNEGAGNAFTQHAIHAVAATTALASVVTKQEVGELSNAFKHLRQALPQAWTQEWYIAARGAELLLKNGEWEKFVAFLGANKNAQHKECLRRICTVLHTMAAHHTHPQMRKQAQTIVNPLLEKHKKLQAYWSEHQILEHAAKQWIFNDLSTPIPSSNLASVWSVFWQMQPNTDSHSLLKQAIHKQQKQIFQQFEIRRFQQQEPRTELHRKIQKLNDHFMRYLNSSGEFRNALSQYVPLKGYAQGRMGPLQDSAQRLSLPLQELHALVDTFLQTKDKKVLLLLGDAGSGKSTFNYHFMREKLQQYTTPFDANQALFIFIPLQNIKNPNGQIIENFLSNQGFTEEQIEQLRVHQRCVFIFDGYDKMRERHFAFYEGNELGRWKNTQFMVVSRPDCFQTGYQKYFHPVGSPELLQECYIGPFSKTQQDAYIAHYAKSTAWSAQEYEAKLAQLEDIETLLERPLTLRLLLQTLPQLKSVSAIPTLGEFYEEYLEQCWQEAHHYLMRMPLTEAEKDVRNTLIEIPNGIATLGMEYAKKGALALVKLHLALFYDYEATDAVCNEVDKYFFGDDKMHQLLYAIGPFMKDEHGIPTFIDYSLEQYAACCAIADDIENELDKIDLTDKPLLIEFLADFVRRGTLSEKALWDQIERTKSEKNPSPIAAANAATILAKAKIPFSDRDLRGVTLRGANLSYAVLDHTQLAGANLTAVNFTGAWMRGVNLDKACLKDAIFGEGIVFKMSAASKSQLAPCLATNESVSYIYTPVKGVSSLVNCYDFLESDYVNGVSTYEPTPHPFGKGHRDALPLTLSANGESLLFLEESGLLAVWSLETKKPQAFFKHEDRIQHIALCDKGHFAASAGLVKKSRLKISSAQEKSLIKIWSTETIDESTLQTKTPRHVFESQSAITSLAISSNGMVAFGTQDAKIHIHVWGSNTRYKNSSYVLPNTAITHSLLISSDGMKIIAGNDNGTVHIWSLDQQEVPERILSGHAQAVRAMDISPCGTLLASGGDDYAIQLWDMPTGKHLHTINGHTRSIERITFSKDSATIYTTSKNRFYSTDESIEKDFGIQSDSYITKYWELDKIPMDYSPRVKTHMRNGVLSPKGTHITSLDVQGALWLHTTNLTSSQKIGQVSEYVESMVFSPDNQWLAWRDYKSGDIVCRSLINSTEYTFKIQHFCFCLTTFSQDSKQLITLKEIKEDKEKGNDKYMYHVQLWSLEKGSEGCLIYERFIPRIPFDYIASFSSDSEYFFVNYKTQNITQYPIKSDEPGRILYSTPVYRDAEIAQREVLDIEEDIYVINPTLSPKGTWLAFTNDLYGKEVLVGKPKKIWLYDLKNSQLDFKNNPEPTSKFEKSGASYIKHCFTTGTTKNIQFAFSPDEKWLAVGEQTRLVIYSISTGESIQTIEYGFTEEIEKISWQEDKIFLSGKNGNAFFLQVISTPEIPLDIRFIWSASYPALTLEGASYEEAQDLSASNMELFGSFNSKTESTAIES